MASNAVPTQTMKVEVEQTPGGGTYIDVGEVQSFSGPTQNKPEIEVTHLNSQQKEYIAGLPDAGQITLAMNYTEPEDAGQALLRTNFETTAAPSINFQVTIASAVFQFAAFVQEFPLDAQTDSKVDLSATLRVTSAFTRT